jgi:hypothetical protein
MSLQGESNDCGSQTRGSGWGGRACSAAVIWNSGKKKLSEQRTWDEKRKKLILRLVLCFDQRGKAVASSGCTPMHWLASTIPLGTHSPPVTGGVRVLVCPLLLPVVTWTGWKYKVVEGALRKKWSLSALFVSLLTLSIFFGKVCIFVLLKRWLDLGKINRGRFINI